MNDINKKNNNINNILDNLSKNKLLNPIIDFIRTNFGILLGLIFICVLMIILTPNFLKANNIINILRQVTTNLNLALGMTIIIIINGIDLSVGSIVALSGTIAGELIAFANWPLPLAIITAVLIGTLCGLFNGVVVAKTQIPPFIATLGMLNIARGIAYVSTGGQPVRVMNESFTLLGSGYIGKIPLQVIYTLIFVIIISLILRKTKLGRHIYAIGGNITAARFSGIKIVYVTIFAYTLSGFLSGFSGVVLASRMYSGQPTAAQGFELDAIAACVLGGTSMRGGVGTIGGTVIGALIIGVLNNGLNLLNINSFWQLIVKGAVILLAVYIDLMKKR